MNGSFSGWPDLRNVETVQVGTTESGVPHFEIRKRRRDPRAEAAERKAAAAERAKHRRMKRRP